MKMENIQIQFLLSAKYTLEMLRKASNECLLIHVNLCRYQFIKLDVSIRHSNGSTSCSSEILCAIK